MRVICTKRGSNVSISENTEYEVINQTEKRFSIINDKGVEKNYCKSLFKVVEEQRPVRERAPRPQPVPQPVIRDINNLNVETIVEYVDNDESHYNIKLIATVEEEGINYSYEVEAELGDNPTAISCGIYQLTGLNSILSTITAFKQTVLNQLSQLPNTRNNITNDDINCGEILEAVLNEVIETSEDVGFNILSTNITNNASITPEYIQVLDNISVATAETRNPNSGNRIKLWTLQVTE